MKILIREELEKDYKEVEELVEEAFRNEEYSDHQEHNLINRLRKSNEFINELSLVVEFDEKLIGHILLSKIKINKENESHESLAMAPVSVLPEHQNKGIGKLLIEKSITEAKRLGYSSIIVLGHENYYPKFGFVKASEFKIRPPFEVPEEAFMALEIEKGSLKDIEGVVEYSSAFFA